MDYEEHKKRHAELHRALDELIADFITHTEKRPSESTVFELMVWSARQMDNPVAHKHYEEE